MEHRSFLILQQRCGGPDRVTSPMQLLFSHMYKDLKTLLGVPVRPYPDPVQFSPGVFVQGHQLQHLFSLISPAWVKLFIPH